MTHNTKVIDMFRKKKEEVQQTPKPFVVKLKQDRYQNWVCGELRCEADTMEELQAIVQEATKQITEELRKLNE